MEQKDAALVAKEAAVAEKDVAVAQKVLQAAVLTRRRQWESADEKNFEKSLKHVLVRFRPT